MKTRKVTKTRKTSKRKTAQQPVSLPELRAGLHHLHSYGQSALKRATSLREAATDFANEWYGVFKKKIPVKDAMDYLKHAVTYNGRSKKKQRGGQAPVGYTMRAGTAVPYGAYPEYISKGFTIPGASVGCKQSGGNILGKIGDFFGGISNTATQVVYHPTSTNPTGVYRDGVTSYKGLPLGPGGDSTSKAYSYGTGGDIKNMAELIKAGQTVRF
jgi:hypothetical protein